MDPKVKVGYSLGGIVWLVLAGACFYVGPSIWLSLLLLIFGTLLGFQLTSQPRFARLAAVEQQR